MKPPPGKPPAPIGQMFLWEHLKLNVPAPAVQSFVHAGTRKTEAEGGTTRELYPLQRQLPPDPLEHLRFALKHEPYDLRVLYTALRAFGSGPLERWLRAEPTSIYGRKAWFLYEHFGGDTLDLEPLKAGNYVGLLDPAQHVVRPQAVRASRQRVLDNLLGTALLCPTVRNTPKLERMHNAGLAARAAELTRQYNPDTLARAISYLYTKETRSSFDIEHEAPTPDRQEHFIRALRQVAEFDLRNL